MTSEFKRWNEVIRRAARVKAMMKLVFSSAKLLNSYIDLLNHSITIEKSNGTWNLGHDLLGCNCRDRNKNRG